MITINQCLENKSKARVSIASRLFFNKILKVIQNGVGNRYDVKAQEWIISWHNVASLLDVASSKNEPVSWDTIAKQTFDIYLKRTSQLIHLKDKTDGVDFNVKMAEGEKLYPFQKVGAAFLYACQRCLLADVVGLGKTNQSLAAVEKYFEEERSNHCLVICPNSLSKKWRRDIARFFSHEAQLVEGANRQHYYDAFLELIHNYMVINYEKVVRDKDAMLEMLKKCGNFSLIFDEAQYIKNYSTKRSRAIYDIANMENCYSIYGLSATYLEKGLDNIYSIFRAIDRSIFGTNYLSFINNYLILDYWGNVASTKNVDDLVERIAPRTIRRQKEQVFEQLPAVTYIDHSCIMPKEQRIVYNGIVEKVLQEINDEDRKAMVARSNALTQVSLLCQACMSSELFGTGESSGKLNVLFEILEGMDSNAKIVIFCHWVKMVEIIGRECQTWGYKNIAMHGQNEAGKYRDENIEKWSNDPEIRLLVTSDILAEGIDLVAASYLINFDILWNPAKMMQRNGRIDRLSQKAKNITIINLIMEDTIEEKIFDVIKKRTELMHTVMDDGFVSDRITYGTLREWLK